VAHPRPEHRVDPGVAGWKFDFLVYGLTISVATASYYCWEWWFLRVKDRFEPGQRHRSGDPELAAVPSVD
jgi:hypothetical protein